MPATQRARPKRANGDRSDERAARFLSHHGRLGRERRRRARSARVPGGKDLLCLASGERCPCADGYPSKSRLHRWNLQGLANRLLGRASGRQLGQTSEQSIWRAEPSRSHEGRRRRRSGGGSKLCGRGASAVELRRRQRGKSIGRKLGASSLHDTRRFNCSSA